MRAKLDALEWDAYHTIRAETAADQADADQGPQGRARAADGGERGPPAPAAFVEDTAVAPERLPEYVERFVEILDRHGLEAGFYGHCSVGCLHIRPFLDVSPSRSDTLEAVAARSSELVAEFDGVNSSEHGDGRVRRPSARRSSAPSSTARCARSRRCSTRTNLLNPGVMVDAEPMTAHLRDAELPQPQVAADPLPLPRGQRCTPPPTAASGSAPAARPAPA